LRDVTRLRAFLAPKNREAARRAIRAIRQSVKVLRTHPELGRPIEEMPPGFRERFCAIREQRLRRAVPV
jgi:plasmid stabilization system protein ParE